MQIASARPHPVSRPASRPCTFPYSERTVFFAPSRSGERPSTPTDRGGALARSVGRLASQCRHRTLRAGRGRGRGELHRAVPDGLRRPSAGRRGRPRGRDTRRRRPGLRLSRRRLGAARAASAPGASAERRLGGRQRVHERHRRSSRLAEPGGLGDAAGGLRARQRHADRRNPELGDRPAQAPERVAGRRRSHPARGARRPSAVAASAQPGADVHADRIPRLGARRVPSSSWTPRRPPGSSSRRRCGFAAGEHRPRQGRGRRGDTKSARFLVLVTKRFAYPSMGAASASTRSSGSPPRSTRVSASTLPRRCLSCQAVHSSSYQ